MLKPNNEFKSLSFDEWSRVSHGEAKAIVGTVARRSPHAAVHC